MRGGFKAYLEAVTVQFLTVKPLSAITSEAQTHSLKRTLNYYDLIFLGIGGIIGSGIFVLTGQAAANYAGPGIVISFIIAGFTALLSAMCYSEMASCIPVAGSAYTYSYAVMGELVAWIIGWDLILEYMVGSATVAVGWSGYLISFIQDAFNVQVSTKLTQPLVDFDVATQTMTFSGNYFNLPAFLIVFLLTILLVLGIQESARFNNVVVVLKLVVVILFIFAAATKVNPANWEPFIPPRENGKYGVLGVFQAATVVFFCFIGSDAVSTTAQECKNPERDLPIGIIGSFTICLGLYVVVSLLLTGMVPYQMLDVSHPLTLALNYAGLEWLAIIVGFGAMAGMSSVILVNLMGQPRIFFSMASDGLLPEIFAKIHPKYKTPYFTTILTGSLCAVLAALLPIDVLAELTSVGTLFAFFLVCLGVMILRVKRPDLPRYFKVPFGPYVIPGLGCLSSFTLICLSPARTLLRLFIWMLVGLIIYAFYGMKNSKLARENRAGKNNGFRNDGLLESIESLDEVQMAPIDDNSVLEEKGTYV